MFHRHGFGHDWHTGDLAYFRHHLKGFFAQPLESIGGGARFECPTAQSMGAGFLHGQRGFDEQTAFFHGTWAGNEQHAIAAHGHPVQREGGILRDELT
ncbi:hypothetical protein SDC9_139548 [bioreactor metagenome]|uniref:Uncharacterized protein n=1 Tax=bioreactor metagenome TaxID=1076179 RepID=A0A645DUZ7_9ZZZZ